MKSLIQITSVLIVIFVILFLAGCNNSGGQDEGSASSTTPPESTGQSTSSTQTAHVSQSTPTTPQGRLELALDLMQVNTYDILGQQTCQGDLIWRNYRRNTFQHHKVEIGVDFEHILPAAGVQYGDFDLARAAGFDFIYRLQQELDIALHFTNHLVIRISNTPFLMENYHNIEYLVDLGRLPLRLDRFLQSYERVITVINCDGWFEIHSDFIIGRPVRSSGVTNAADTQRIINRYDRLYLVFEYVTPTIRLQLWDYHNFCRINGPTGDPLDIENAGRNVRMAIPLSFDESEGSSGNPTYNAVFYTDPIRNTRAILPRSFVNGDYLYIFLNRLGTFELTATPNGATTDVTEFLRDRNIEFRGDAHDYVTRGQFYYNLLQVHWAEGLHFLLRDYRPEFPDIPDIPTSERVHIGRNLQVSIEGGASPNFILDGHVNRMFRPNSLLTRRHLYMLLAGNIAYFDFDVYGLMPKCEDAIISPEYLYDYWFYRFEFLREIGFVPYARDENETAFAAPSSRVTVYEAENILFMLILGREQYDAWQN
ncbi:MAG: hypothetical protein FWC77_00285 [Defluviitaleaceae bacterium]|nr:hypothetical protein [Defluviitaleaceae bacterium]